MSETVQTRALADVLAERRRQVEAEGWTPAHDDQYRHDELAIAAACYCAPDAVYWGPAMFRAALRWPWAVEWWKPSDGRYGRPIDRRRDLIKACALNLAALEQLDRLGNSDPKTPADGEAGLGPSVAAELLAQLKHAVHWHDQLTPEDIARYEAVIAKAEGQP